MYFAESTRVLAAEYAHAFRTPLPRAGQGRTQTNATGSMNRKEPVIHNEKSLPKYIIADCCHSIPNDDMPGYPDSDGHAYIHKLSAIN